MDYSHLLFRDEKTSQKKKRQQNQYMKINNESYHSTAWARKRERTLTSDTYTVLEKDTSDISTAVFFSSFLT